MGNKIGAVLTGEEIKNLNIESLAGFMAHFLHHTSSDGMQQKALMAPMTKEEFAVAPITERIIEAKFVINPFKPENLDIDGIDFTVGERIYETDLVYGKISSKELEVLVDRGIRKCNLGENEVVLYPGKVYYVLSEEKIKIPDDLDMIIDSKSTIGRLACICHDATLPSLLKNFPTNLIGVVRPGVFPLKVSSLKSKLFQGIFKYSKKSHMTREELLKSGKIIVEVDGKKKPIETCIDEDKLKLHFSTRRAYVSKRKLKDIEPIDVDRTDLNWREYFEEVKGDSQLILEPGRFYLLGTKEYLRFGEVCGRITRDLGGHLTGLWTQFAGIVHAGFHGEITLECKTDLRRVIRNGDLAGHIEVDKLAQENYDLSSGQGSYSGQKAPRLPKVFKQD